MSDLIDRQAAIDALGEGAMVNYQASGHGNGLIKAIDVIKGLPSARPERTDEQAIEHLQSTGWMQNHDREIYESGLREQLADDSGSYDSLIPCEGTISRQAAIDALDIAIERYDEMAEEYQKKADIERNDYMDMRDDAYEARQLAQWLNELKYLRGKIEQLTIKPEQRWIPCSERLPEERGFYLTTTKDKAVYCDHWNEDNFDRTEMVIAWMPMPEPYQGGEQDDR